VKGAALIAVILLVGPSAAWAQDDEAEARRLYARGTELARDEERCGDAIEFFRRAIAIRETPQRVLSLAACLAATGQHVEAIETFTHYLEMDGIGADDRRAARSALADERRAVGTLELTVEPESAEVYVDGARREGSGAERHLLLDPGTRSLEVRAEGYASRRVEASSLPGGSGRLTIRLERDVGAAPRVAVDADQREAEILIDGTVVGRGSYEGTVEEGSHRIEVRASGFADFREEVDARYGETVRVHARLGATTSGGGENLAESPILWTIVAIVAVGAGVGIGVGVWASQPQIDSGNTGVILMGLHGEF
jgi:hypothetical protein